MSADSPAQPPTRPAPGAAPGAAARATARGRATVPTPAQRQPPRAGSDFLQLSAPDRGIGGPGLTDWLTAQIRAAIIDGRLGAGTLLPASRTLAGELRLSRGVVVEAYRRLTDEALIAARRGSGTIVLARPSDPGEDDGAGQPTATAPLLPNSPTLPAGAAGPDPTVRIDLSPGLPDLAGFPHQEWAAAGRRALAGATASDLGYGDPRGHPRLRAELADWLGRSRGVRTHPDGIVVVNGVAQALALLAQVLLRAGQTSVAVEDPGSRGAREQFEYWGLSTERLPVDHDGADTAALQRLSVRTASLTPAHEFPMGVVLSPARRQQLLAWAEAADGLLIEDDYDAEFRYDRPPVPAVQASAPHRVAYTGSTSKTLAPGLRLGWLVPPKHLLAEVVSVKHATDLGACVLPQLVLAQWIGSGRHERHIRAVRTRYRQRRDALVSALQGGLTGRAPFVLHGVAAGLHLVVGLPELTVPDTVLAERLLRNGIRVQPLSWHAIAAAPRGLVLGYAATSADRLREAGTEIAEQVLALR
ncbi:PLP-dependent aminotransferase family protein [Nakamurella aerolata]|uniref:PLP-dependent aminotransferase family protein n=1 Tax=Nakamurella aerolata TaxID=1656892 RepID=A0A849A2F0_9ACTN|nr:PLP-dependent aminotransferase family protein [Nakamurella aerolata]NNG35224.1 PLP-dependent aminotransferase family protein [Nakamurella aerolata]